MHRLRQGSKHVAHNTMAAGLLPLVVPLATAGLLVLHGASVSSQGARPVARSQIPACAPVPQTPAMPLPI